MATISEALAIALQHHQAGRLEMAEEIYRRILAVEPNQPDALHRLGVIAHQVGKHEVAIRYIMRAIECHKKNGAFHNNLGEVYRALQRMPEAVACYRRALEVDPHHVGALNNLGTALKGYGKLDDSVGCYRRALELKPDYAEAHYNLGNVFQDQGNSDDAVACYRRALELKPDLVEAHYNLGNALLCLRKVNEAVVCYRRALELQPNYPEAHNNLGTALKDHGKLDDAVACYRRALELKPDYAGAHSNIVYTLNFSADCDARQILQEARQWNQRHSEPLAEFITPHPNNRSPNRRLRVGYVSPDFREHCQSFFTVPLLSAHDRTDFQLVCYSDVMRPDRVTARLSSCVDTWRSIAGLSDEQVAELVRQDGIDILVDLTMHMARNRLLMFARKPAPVQVSWLAYPGTTGLSTIDYRLTDPYLDPPGLNEGHYSEESVRLPDTFWCYDPLTSQPAGNAPPVLGKGYVTFGCLNNFCKSNPLVLKTWARVLRAVDGSRLMILADERIHRQHTLDLMVEEGVARDRVTFVVQQPRQEYLRYHDSVDIGLDTFPYNGHTTSLDSYWMGVPVVTLVGPTVVGRAGLSQLTNLDLTELVARTPDEFVSIAARLARDLPRLGHLRATLRERMQRSPLMDAPRFARGIEAAYRSMWQRWCKHGDPTIEPRGT